jgi:hypothetical protein
MANLLGGFSLRSAALRLLKVESDINGIVPRRGSQPQMPFGCCSGGKLELAFSATQDRSSRLWPQPLGQIGRHGNQPAAGGLGLFCRKCDISPHLDFSSLPNQDARFDLMGLIWAYRSRRSKWMIIVQLMVDYHPPNS